MSAHTPGPWEYAGHPGASMPLLHVYCSDNRGVAHEDRSQLELEANATLIAAAPDLLEALQYVLSAHGEQLTDAFERAHKAIAKATGATP